MKRRIPFGSVVALTVFLAMAGSSQAGARETSAARSYCQAERQENGPEFSSEYGRGAAGLSRCVRKNLTEARTECRRDLRSEPSRFAARYGGRGVAAINRCIRDDLKVVTSSSY